MLLEALKVLVAGLLALSVAGVAADDKKDKPTDAKKILGTWTIESFMEGGQKAKKEAIEDIKVTITAEKITVTQGAKEQEYTYTLDSTQKPRAIDLKNAKGDTVAGIYKLEGDKLTVCFARRGDRPAQFESEKGTSVVLEVLKREKN
jgi:uncharacterized protein (TIGR03067 family)